MTIESPSAAVVQNPHAAMTPPRPAAIVDPAFEERWAAWRARGARHDAVVRRRMRIVGVIALALLGLVALRMMLGLSL